MSTFSDITTVSNSFTTQGFIVWCNTAFWCTPSMWCFQTSNFTDDSATSNSFTDLTQ